MVDALLAFIFFAICCLQMFLLAEKRNISLVHRNVAINRHTGLKVTVPASTHSVLNSGITLRALVSPRPRRNKTSISGLRLALAIPTVVANINRMLNTCLALWTLILPLGSIRGGSGLTSNVSRFSNRIKCFLRGIDTALIPVPRHAEMASDSPLTQCDCRLALYRNLPAKCLWLHFVSL